jgi:hypothetical protein
MLQYLKGAYLQQIKQQKGWKRTGIHEVVDALLTGINRKPSSTSAAKYLVVNGKSLPKTSLSHLNVCIYSEWDSESSAKDSQVTTSEELVNGQVEERQWQLYRAWDNTATPAIGRFKPAYPAPGTSDISDRIRVRRGGRGLTPLDGALLNAPEIAVGLIHLILKDLY